MKEISKRIDDTFLRRVIWFLLTMLVGAAASFVVMWTQVQANTAAIQKFDRQYETITEIKIMVATLVSNSEERNALLKKVSEQQNRIYGEQKRRAPIIERTQKHLDDRGLHK